MVYRGTTFITNKFLVGDDFSYKLYSFLQSLLNIKVSIYSNLKITCYKTVMTICPTQLVITEDSRIEHGFFYRFTTLMEQSCTWIILCPLSFV